MFEKSSALHVPSTPSRPFTESDESGTYAKINIRIIPVLLFAFILAYLDRVNVGYAQLQMRQMLGFSDAVYGLGAGLFFITYMIFELPSNLWLERVGARKTFVRIMVLWGLCSTATMFVRTPVEFYIVRLMLGACEAGFFPGLMLYLTYWYPSGRRGRVTGFLLSGIPISGILGGAVSGTIISNLDGVWGLAGWQWVFLLEGLPTVIFAFVLYVLLPDRPEDANWLRDSEKELVRALLNFDHSVDGDKERSRGKIFKVLANPQTYILSFIYFCLLCMVYVMTFWLPTIIKMLGVSSLGKIGWAYSSPVCIWTPWAEPDQLQLRYFQGASLSRGEYAHFRFRHAVCNYFRSLDFLANDGAVVFVVFFCIRFGALLGHSADAVWQRISCRRHRSHKFSRYTGRLRKPMADWYS